MTLEQIVDTITKVGFPIVMCGALAWYVKHMTDKFMAMVDSINTQHDNETKNMIKSLDANTKAIEVLSNRLGMHNVGDN